jgi:hypothetical protein
LLREVGIEPLELTAIAGGDPAHADVVLDHMVMMGRRSRPIECGASPPRGPFGTDWFD